MQQQRGFTLLEMLLVLVIAAMIAGLSLVSVRSLLAYSERKTQADRFETVVKDAPRQAVKRLCWTRLDIDPAARLLSVHACGALLHRMEWNDEMEIVVTQMASPNAVAPAATASPTPLTFWFSPKADTPGVVLALKSGEQVVRELDLRPFAQ